MTAASAAPGRVRLGVGAVVVLALLALAVTVVVGVIRTASVPEPLPVATASVDPIAPPQVYVHVSGAVARPGLYLLGGGARVADAISAAGGLTEQADAAAVNLARELVDGEQLAVPEIGQAPAPAEAGPAEPGGLIDLNTADLDRLDELPRVGPAIAQRIIDWREQNGPFASVEDLLAVPGIGAKMLAALRDLVTV